MLKSHNVSGFDDLLVMALGKLKPVYLTGHRYIKFSTGMPFVGSLLTV